MPDESYWMSFPYTPAVTDLTPEGIVRTFYEALNARDYARAAGPIAETCDWMSMPTENLHRGPAAVVAGLREFTSAFPDWHVDVERVILAGHVVVIEWRTTGTFEKAFRGRAPNGRRFSRRGCAVAEVERGQIVRYRDYYDRASLFAQLDLMDMFKP
jgi:steroid delta-isomerase-like uncharacterized protein